MEYSIPKKEHDNVMACFWTMMRECESTANNNDDRVLKVQVEGFAKLWNRVTNDSFQPKWTK